jgi:hypothetical protein
MPDAGMPLYLGGAMSFENLSFPGSRANRAIVYRFPAQNIATSSLIFIHFLMEDKLDKPPVVKGFKAFNSKAKAKEPKEPKEKELTAEELQTIRMISGMDEEPVNKYVT